MLLFFSFLSLSLAASPTSFCKCTCFTNSTIIPLDAPPSSDKPTEPDTGTNPTRLALRDAELDPLALETRDILPTNGSENKVHGRTCADCNKQFCLSYNLPICAGATEENVLTTCFQRDSVKDQLVVWIFLIATVGLLAWATVKPWWTRWREGYGAVPG
ncbi:hypothetical protein CBER1_08902 [Cercospora berteroae]|uniref:Uncharacterized protein n=1 Tax=Cercospora berteroae TaxID=357750 RepID=A0A2S6BW77_9PEZI|nr:hypothetical protein CBER1_08902 [Cercospora berteroae]